MNDEEFHSFFEDLVRTLRSRGVLCGITSGLACVHYGVAESTKDCDLLCHPGSFQTLLDLLAETSVAVHSCRYRGHLSPPLDARWHRGGWTSHVQWDTHPVVTKLDVFGLAVRQSSPWQDDLAGLYAGRNIVAEMKRTDREKDWPFITLLGLRLIHAGDSRGWLHLFDADTILEELEDGTIPDAVVAVRPVLQLALRRDPRLHPALLAERHLWQELDRRRIRIYRSALRPFVLAMGRAGLSEDSPLLEQHAARVACAEKVLDPNPVGQYGVERLIHEARAATEAFVRPELLPWLPDVYPHFKVLAL